MAPSHQPFQPAPAHSSIHSTGDSIYSIHSQHRGQHIQYMICYAASTAARVNVPASMPQHRPKHCTNGSQVVQGAQYAPSRTMCLLPPQAVRKSIRAAQQWLLCHFSVHMLHEVPHARTAP
eukprot:136563-Chlamydomonas_euryale.AAC.2